MHCYALFMHCTLSYIPNNCCELNFATHVTKVTGADNELAIVTIHDQAGNAINTSMKNELLSQSSSKTCGHVVPHFKAVWSVD